MYDKLIKALRVEPFEVGSAGLAKTMNEAADAIEELQATLCNWCAVCSEDKRDLSTCEIYESCRAKPPKWIPVTERLPEFEGAVLCMRKSNVYGVRQYQEILYVDEFGFKNFDDIYLADGVVTHWMPLPQPPEEGE